MTGLEVTGITVGIGTFISFQSWLAVTIVRTQSSVAALQARMNAKDTECGERMEMLSSLFSKVNLIAEDTAFIKGKIA